MPFYNYKCTNAKCENSKGFEIELPISKAPFKECRLCQSKVNTVFNSSVNVNLNFKDSYNSSRK